MSWYKIANKTISDADFVAAIEDPWEKVESSFIDAIAYFPSPRVLEIKLKDGHRYAFMNVSEEMYHLFMVAPSKGRFFNQFKQWYNQL